jgi:hypothetical protein
MACPTLGGEPCGGEALPPGNAEFGTQTSVQGQKGWWQQARITAVHVAALSLALGPLISVMPGRTGLEDSRMPPHVDTGWMVCRSPRDINPPCATWSGVHVGDKTSLVSAPCVCVHMLTYSVVCENMYSLPTHPSASVCACIFYPCAGMCVHRFEEFLLSAR